MGMQLSPKEETNKSTFLALKQFAHRHLPGVVVVARWEPRRLILADDVPLAGVKLAGPYLTPKIAELSGAPLPDLVVEMQTILGWPRRLRKRLQWSPMRSSLMEGVSMGQLVHWGNEAYTRRELECS